MDRDSKKVSNITDEKIKTNMLIISNIKYLMKTHNYNSAQLLSEMESHGLKVNQGSFSNLLNKPQSNYVPIPMVIKLCDIFDIPLNNFLCTDLSDPNNDNNKLKNLIKPDISTSNNELIWQFNHRVFNGYKGKYFCYLFPTISSEKNILKGTLEFGLENDPNGVLMTLHIIKKGKHTTKIIEKCYRGVLIMSRILCTCYCILKSDQLGELCFFAFRHFYLNTSPLDCRMAETLTVSAGESNYPTVHRLFFSREEIKDKDLDLLKPMLHLNTSEIILSEDSINILKEEDKIPSVILNHITQKVENQQFYIFKEDLFTSILKNYLDSNQKNKIPQYVSLIREKSVMNRYNKVSGKLDDTVRNLLLDLGYYE